MKVATSAFWADADYDRRAASDGVSRFRKYLLTHVRDGRLNACWDGTFSEDGDRAVEFCQVVWRLACAPLMAPGYVRWHPRVIAAEVRRSDWDDELVALVKLVAPQPPTLAGLLSIRTELPWLDRPTERRGDAVSFADPDGEDLARARYATCDLNLGFPLELRTLAAPPDGPEDDVETRARLALSAIVNALNAAVDPVLAALEEAE
jgi:hypothetical protein